MWPVWVGISLLAQASGPPAQLLMVGEQVCVTAHHATLASFLEALSTSLGAEVVVEGDLPALTLDVDRCTTPALLVPEVLDPLPITYAVAADPTGRKAMKVLVGSVDGSLRPAPPAAGNPALEPTTNDETAEEAVASTDEQEDDEEEADEDDDNPFKPLPEGRTALVPVGNLMPDPAAAPVDEVIPDAEPLDEELPPLSRQGGARMPGLGESQPPPPPEPAPTPEPKS